MPNTPNRTYPYPVRGDQPGLGWRDMERLALAIDTDVATVVATAAALATTVAALPRGIIKRAQRTTASSTTTAADAGVLRLDSISLLTGRQYRIWTTPLHMDSSVSNDEIRCRLRYSTVGTATTASTIMPGATIHTRQTDANVSDDRPISTLYTPGGNETMSILLCVGRIAGTGNVSIDNSDTDDTIEIVVEDIGLAVTDTGVDI